MKIEPTEEKYRAETCSSPIGETGDYDSWIELVTPDFNLQCYDPDIDFEQVEEFAKLLNKAASYPKIKQLEWVLESGHWARGWHISMTRFGVSYEIRESENDGNVILYDILLNTTIHDTVDEAKAAAQADFERRVKECLDI